MAEAVLVSRFPTVEEFISLRREAGWHVPQPDAVIESLKNTLFAVCVEEDGKFVGSGRIIGDGALVYVVEGVIILPEYQKKGYGTMIMDALMRYIQKNAKPTSHISLFAARGLEHFYNRYGFIERPHGQLGPGMAFFKT